MPSNAFKQKKAAKNAMLPKLYLHELHIGKSLSTLQKPMEAATCICSFESVQVSMTSTYALPVQTVIWLTNNIYSCTGIAGLHHMDRGDAEMQRKLCSGVCSCISSDIVPTLRLIGGMHDLVLSLWRHPRHLCPGWRIPTIVHARC